MNGVHLDIDLTTADVVVQAQAIEVDVVTDVPGVTFGVPGPTGLRGLAGATGPPGEAGEDGATGLPGATGPGAPGGRWRWVVPPNGRDLAPGQVGVDNMNPATELRIRVEDLDGNDWYDPVLTFLDRGNRVVLTQVDDPTITRTYEVQSYDWNDDGSTFWIPVATDGAWPHSVYFADGVEVTVAFLFGLTPSDPPPRPVITWPTGSEPSLDGVADGTLWVEFSP